MNFHCPAFNTTFLMYFHLKIRVHNMSIGRDVIVDKSILVNISYYKLT
jgi:hypothetical protein